MIWITRFYYGLGIALLSVFSIWLIVQVNQDQLIQHAVDPNTPNAYATQLVLTELDQQGHVKSHFYAVKATRYPSNVTDLEAPRAILYKTANNGVSHTFDIGGALAIDNTEATPPWTIRAKHGRIRNQGEVLDLWGDVHVEQAKGKNNQATVLVTSQLTYYPKTRLANTKQPVDIKQSDGNAVSAVGMKANLNTGDITFLSKMRGRYEMQ